MTLTKYYHIHNMKHNLGFFYIIGCKSFPNYYKIGHTKDVEGRLNAYQTYSPHRDFYIHRYIPVIDSKKSEDSIKEHYNDRMMNEWFYSHDISSDFKDIANVIANTLNRPNRFSTNMRP